MPQYILFPRTLLSLLLLLWCASYGYCARRVDFQNAQPPPLPRQAKQCTVPILRPEVVDFTPPTNCSIPGSWAGISLNFTVTSDGNQHDRLGFFIFQDVEIWRTSTPEPKGDDIIWTYIKDVTRFIPLFSKPGKFVLQLDNVVDSGSGLDGNYATTLEATFFASSSQFPPATQADMIVPLTTLTKNTGDVASVPPGFSLNVTLPRNAVAAFAELQASGNDNDEFWYLNAPNQYLDNLPRGSTFGTGPFREVRVLVDGQLAGGLDPGAWSCLEEVPSPITSYGALDLPVYHLDLTPSIPILTDGEPHNITLDVASAEPDHQINQNWFLSGLLHVKFDSSTKPTTGKITRYEASDFATSNVSLSASDLNMSISLNASRSVHIEAEIIAGSGARTEVVFSQNLEFRNVQNYLQNFTTQNLYQIAFGGVLSSHNGKIVLQDNFSYPLIINTVALSDNSSYSIELDHSYNRILLPAPFILGTTIFENQLVGGYVGSDWFGTNNNTFNYSDTAGNKYKRQVNASNNVITFDSDSGGPAPNAISNRSLPVSPEQVDMESRLPGGRVIDGT
ncbi:peptide N-acetyl-beta-D-glucosaminyl asparaginase amidase A-domain-containing protein [Lactarius indigo]|nr:peptide N-acetyl-beta-D-glucosaminyl asparaginase amidase A-domain-containing protein [Lactarius indigo]